MDLYDTACEVQRIWDESNTNDDVFVGIDPGASGGVAFLVYTGLRWACLVADIPTIVLKRKGGTKTVFNNAIIANAFHKLPRQDSLQVALEEAQVQVRGKGANAYTGFRIGVSYGMWPLFLASIGCSVETIHPAVWKTAMGLRGKDKEASRLKALGLWPRADLQLKKHEGRAEAALLAEWLRRRHRGGDEPKLSRKR